MKKAIKGEDEILDRDKVFLYLTSGIFARMCAATLLYPIDTVKARCQYSKKVATKGFYRNGLNTFYNVLKNEGVLSLYSGLGIKLLYTIPSAAISFTIYEQVNSLLSQMIEKKKLKGVRLLAVSCLAGAGFRVFGTFVRTPFDLLKIRMQVETGPEQQGGSRLWNKVKYSMEHKDFFTGFRITLMRDVPFAAIYFTTYEITKRWIKRSGRVPYEGMGRDIAHMASGAVAAVVSTSCTIPFDVVKTRLQTRGDDYQGIINTFSRIYQEEGIRAFSKGLGMRIFYLIPAASLTFAFYERFKGFLMDRKLKESKDV